MRTLGKIIFTVLTALSLLSCSEINPEQRIRTAVSEEQFLEGKALSGDLPVLFVYTADGKEIKEKTRSKSATMTLYDARGDVLVSNAQLSIKGRGHGSWGFPKKPYNIKTARSVTVPFGGTGTDWCLLANWRDMTLMRNDIALKMASGTVLDWTPRGCFVELVLNGIHQGNYYLSPRVRAAQDRVDVGLGGWLVCFDNYYDSDYRFKTRYRQLPSNIKMADGQALDRDAFEAVRSSVDAAEAALYHSVGDWQELIDAESFCDWLIIHELAGNDEPTRPHSVYIHKKADGKITAGPCWDFDCRTFTPGREGILNRRAVWFDALLADPDFRSLLKSRWAALKPFLSENIPPYILETWSGIEQSVIKDREIWPISPLYSNANGDEGMSPQQAALRLEKAYGQRLQSLDVAISAL